MTYICNFDKHVHKWVLVLFPNNSSRGKDKMSHFIVWPFYWNFFIKYSKLVLLFQYIHILLQKPLKINFSSNTLWVIKLIFFNRSISNQNSRILCKVVLSNLVSKWCFKLFLIKMLNNHSFLQLHNHVFEATWDLYFLLVWHKFGPVNVF